MANRSYSHLYYHFVWATYYRDKSILPEWEYRMYGHIIYKSKLIGAIPIALGGTDDHIHLMLRARPDSIPADLIGKIKGASSYFVNHTICSRPHFSWQKGYGAFSVSRNSIKSVIDYIRKQKQHHKQGTILPEYEKTDSEDDEEESGIPECVIADGVNDSDNESAFQPRHKCQGW
ncbi:MAG: IS200/IS605 family transposase [Chitinispirillaceae bacterium]